MLELTNIKASYKANTVSVTLSDGYYNFITRISVPGLTRRNKSLVFLRIRDLMRMNISWDLRCRYLSGQCFGGVILGDCRLLGRRRTTVKGIKTRAGQTI